MTTRAPSPTDALTEDEMAAIALRDFVRNGEIPHSVHCASDRRRLLAALRAARAEAGGRISLARYREVVTELDASRAREREADAALAPLDEVVHLLGIEDSDETPAEAIKRREIDIQTKANALYWKDTDALRWALKGMQERAEAAEARIDEEYQARLRSDAEVLRLEERYGDLNVIRDSELRSLAAAEARERALREALLVFVEATSAYDDDTWIKNLRREAAALVSPPSVESGTVKWDAARAPSPAQSLAPAAGERSEETGDWGSQAETFSRRP